MVAASRPIKVSEESNLVQLLDDASESPVLLEKNGVVFRLSVADPDDIWAGYDPERSRRILREMAGSITPEEGERIKKLIYRGREEGTRPANRP